MPPQTPIQPGPPQMPATPAPAPLPPTPPPVRPRRSKTLRILLAALVVIGVFLAAAGATMLVLKLTSQNIKLTTYATSRYSLQVPESYQKDASGTTVNFNEPDKDPTQSRVMVYFSGFPTPLPENEVKSIRDTLRTQLGTSVEDLAKKGTQKLDDLKVSEGKFKGKDALWLRASVSEDGKPSGKVKLVAVIDSKQLYMIGVAAHEADKGLWQHTDEIINSFVLK